MAGWRGVVLAAGAVVALGLGAPVAARAETGPTGSGGLGVAPAPVWIAPSEKPGAGAPAAEGRATCGDLVAWADGPAGSGTWAARPTEGAGTGAPVVIGTWHRAGAGVAPLATLGQLAPGRYQLTFEGDLFAARMLTVDCGAGAAPAPAVIPASSLAPPAALPYTPVPTDAEGSTVPPVSEQTVPAASWAPGVPRSPVAGLIAAGLLAAVGIVVGARRTA